jgi:hypothetical protein
VVRRVLILIGVLVALVGVAAGLAISFQERIAPPPPPPIALPPPGPDSPELSTHAQGASLEVAGIRIRLPRGSRIHPSRIHRTTEVVRVEARTGLLFLGVTFYTRDHGILGEPYQAALAGPVEAGQRALLFGEDRPVLREQHQRPGGHVLRFDMAPTPSRRHRSLLVAQPAKGGGLATLTVEYTFSPKAARDVAALPEAIEFVGESAS